MIREIAGDDDDGGNTRLTQHSKKKTHTCVAHIQSTIRYSAWERAGENEIVNEWAKEMHNEKKILIYDIVLSVVVCTCTCFCLCVDVYVFVCVNVSKNSRTKKISSIENHVIKCYAHRMCSRIFYMHFCVWTRSLTRSLTLRSSTHTLLLVSFSILVYRTH